MVRSVLFSVFKQVCCSVHESQKKYVLSFSKEIFFCSFFQDNSTSLLQYLVRYFVSHFDADAGTDRAKLPMPEPSDVVKAGLVNFDEVEQEIQKISFNTKSE